MSIEVSVLQCCCWGMIYRAFHVQTQIKLEAVWFCDLSLVLVLTCHKKNKNNSILAYSVAASHTSLRSADSHSDWGVKKNNPCWTFMWRGSTEGPTPVFFLFFSPLFLSPVNAFLFHGPSDGIPSSVSCCLCELLGNHGSCPVGRDFFFILLVWLGGSEGHKVSIWVGCFTVFMLAFWYMGKSNALFR